VAKIPVGIPDAEITRILTVIEAQGEVANVPPARLDDILAKARSALELKEQRPIVPNGPPGPPPLLNP